MSGRCFRQAPGCCAARQSCVWFAEDGRCHVVHAAEDGSKADSIVSETIYAQGDWVRLSMSFDYTGAKPDFTLCLNGIYRGEYGCFGGKRKISGFDVTGETALDDVIFTGDGAGRIPPHPGLHRGVAAVLTNRRGVIISLWASSGLKRGLKRGQSPLRR